MPAPNLEPDTRTWTKNKFCYIGNNKGFYDLVYTENNPDFTFALDAYTSLIANFAEAEIVLNN